MAANKSTKTKDDKKFENSVVTVTDADGRVHYTSRTSRLATAPGAKVEEVPADETTEDAPAGDGDNAGTASS